MIPRIIRYLCFRFSAEQKTSRDPYSFLPFGMGPRNCVGMRLAVLESRILMARMLQKLKIVPADDTPVSGWRIFGQVLVL